MNDRYSSENEKGAHYPLKKACSFIENSNLSAALNTGDQ